MYLDLRMFKNVLQKHWGGTWFISHWMVFKSVSSSARLLICHVQQKMPSLRIICIYWTILFCVLTVSFLRCVFESFLCDCRLSEDCFGKRKRLLLCLFSFPPAVFCWCAFGFLASYVKRMTEKSIRKHSRLVKYCRVAPQLILILFCAW